MENTQVGPFLVIKKTGHNRRHNVYHARQVEQNRDVALKFIKFPKDVDRDTALAKLNREVLVIKQLEHENLVRLYGAGTHEEKVFFAHELIDGESLAGLLGRRGRLAHDLVIDYGTQIATALEYLHENEVIHSKLISDKVLVDANGNIKIADLRLNRPKKRRWDAARRVTLEVAAYMPPEQLLGAGATAKADIYALGVLLYEMLTGRLPFEPQTMAQLARDKQSNKVRRVAEDLLSCPAWLDKLVFQMLQPDASKRPHSAQAVRLTLEQIRNVAQSKKTAAEEMSSGFSALTAGKDKTEARRLLGHKEPKKRRDEQPPAMQSMPIIVSSLVMVSLLIALFVWWPFSGSREDQMTKANLLANSANHSDWQDARKIYKKLMKSRDPEIADLAKTKHSQSRRKSMLYRLDRGLSAIEKPEIRQFYRGYKMQKEGRPDQAMRLYREMVDEYGLGEGGDEDPMAYVFDEANERLNELIEQRKRAESVREEIKNGLDEADSKVADKKTLPEAIKYWREIADKYETNEFLGTLVSRAKTGLQLHDIAPDEGAEKSGVNAAGESTQQGSITPKGSLGKSSADESKDATINDQ